MCGSLKEVFPTDGIYAFCENTSPRKNKYGICVCSQKCFFFLFNSKYYGFNPLPQLKSTPDDFPFLTKECYLDTARVVEYGREDVQKAVAAGKVWRISNEMKQQIKTNTLFHGQLPQKYERLIEKYF